MLWAVAVSCLLLTVKPGYARSLFSWQTGVDFSRSYFVNNADDDRKRIIIFQMNHAHWQPIRKNVQQWLKANRVKWESSKPIWFTEGFVQSIPDDIWKNDDSDLDEIFLGTDA